MDKSKAVSYFKNQIETRVKCIGFMPDLSIHLQFKEEIKHYKLALSLIEGGEKSDSIAKQNEETACSTEYHIQQMNIGLNECTKCGLSFFKIVN